MNSSSFEQGLLVTANILYSNQIGLKPRPALVISGSMYNNQSDDIVVLKVTSSKEKPFPYNVDLEPSDVTGKPLKNPSTIMADFPITIDKMEVRQVIGTVSANILAQVKQKMRELYGI